MSSAAIAPKRLARDLGLPRGEGNNLDSQFRKQEVDITCSIITTAGLHDDSDLDKICSREHPFGVEASARDPLRIRFLIQDRDERRCIDNHFGTPISS